MNKLLPSPLPDGTTSYLGQLARIPLLTRDGEVEIAKRIEACEHEMLEALLHCKVIQMRFGVGGSEEQSLERVGERFGVMRESRRQVEAKALAWLKLRAGYLRSFLEGRAEP